MCEKAEEAIEKKTKIFLRVLGGLDIDMEKIKKAGSSGKKAIEVEWI